MWPSPGKEPRKEIDRTIVITVHHESTFRAMVRPFPQRHGLYLATATTGFGRVAFVLYHQFFAIALAFVGEHLGEGVQAPIIEHSSIEDVVALLMLPHDHLSLTQITDHHSSLNQLVRDKMRCFVQAITLLVALFLCHTLVDLAQSAIATRLLLAGVAFRADAVELPIVPPTSFEATDMVG